MPPTYRVQIFLYRVPGLLVSNMFNVLNPPPPTAPSYCPIVLGHNHTQDYPDFYQNHLYQLLLCPMTGGLEFIVSKAPKSKQVVLLFIFDKEMKKK